MPSRQLSTADVTAARLAYEAGATFGEIGQRYGVSETGMRRLLRAVGVEPRRRGKQLVEIEAPELVLADWHNGLSCRQIAEKHGLVDHKPVARFLRDRGVDLGSRPARQKVPGMVLGSRITNLQAQRRRKPPMVIPCRTAAERMVRTWTRLELAAIAQALDAGRVTHAPRGRSGLPERPSFAERQAAGIAFMYAMKRIKVAA